MPEMLAGWMAPYLTDEGKLSLVRNSWALNTNHTMELLEDLQKLTQPLLLLRTAKEQFHDLSSAERFIDEFPGTQLHVVPDSDHFLLLEKPEEVARILIDLLG